MADEAQMFVRQMEITAIKNAGENTPDQEELFMFPLRLGLSCKIIDWTPLSFIHAAGSEPLILFTATLSAVSLDKLAKDSGSVPES